MTTDKEEPILNHEAASKEEEISNNASAPTVLDLRAALKDMFADAESELDLMSPDDGLPQQQD
jgi:hypothetical protein